MEALSVDPVPEAAVVAGVVGFDQFVAPIRQHFLGQVFEPFPFGVGGTLGVVLTGDLLDSLERVVGDGGDQFCAATTMISTL